MQARAHLKLIVSEPHSEPDASAQDRTSMVQPVSNLRLRLRLSWQRTNAGVLALWSATVVLLAAAGLLLVSRL